MKKYRVHYIESESGWGSNSWHTDYDTEQEAIKMVEDTNKKYCSSPNTPSYYIKATYMGEVKV